MIVKSENTSSSNIYTWFKNLIIWIFAILGTITFILTFLIIFGIGGISSQISSIITYSGLFTISATLFLVSITVYYAYATKKMADSTQQMTTLTHSNIENTIKTIKVMNETKWHQVLTDIHKDYRSPEMMLAVSGLWDFYRKCKDIHKEKHLKIGFEKYLKREFMRRYNKEKKEIDDKKLDIKKSLNYKKRLLTHFYFHLATLYVHGITVTDIPNNMIFDWWMPNDLIIIDKVLIPFHEPMKKNLSSLEKKYSEKELYVFKKYLRKLKEDCDKYYDNMQIT